MPASPEVESILSGDRVAGQRARRTIKGTAEFWRLHQKFYRQPSRAEQRDRHAVSMMERRMQFKAGRWCLCGKGDAPQVIKDEIARRNALPSRR